MYHRIMVAVTVAFAVACLHPDRRETRRSHSIASNIEHTKQTAPEIETHVAFVA
jgi:hypothetical protein